MNPIRAVITANKMFLIAPTDSESLLDVLFGYMKGEIHDDCAAQYVSWESVQRRIVFILLKFIFSFGLKLSVANNDLDFNLLMSRDISRQKQSALCGRNLSIT